MPKRPQARENLGEQIKKTKALCLNAVRARENLGEQIKETKALCLTAIKSSKKPKENRQNHRENHTRNSSISPIVRNMKVAPASSNSPCGAKPV